MKRKSRAQASQRKPGASASAAPRVIILAAGLGSRMRSARPKVLHKVAGRTLLEAVLASAEGLRPERVVVVIGAGRESVAASLEGRDVAFAIQDPPLGTGDAAARPRALGEARDPSSCWRGYAAPARRDPGARPRSPAATASTSRFFVRSARARRVRAGRGTRAAT
jgi:hypothetical protein